MAVHVAIIVEKKVTSVGVVKSKETMSLGESMTASQELRVKEDPAIPSTEGFPTIKEYIELEEQAGFRLNHIDQSYIITYDTTP